MPEKTQAEWEAEGDAHTLVMAAEIRADDTRLRAAAAKVPAIQEEAKDRLNSVNRLAAGLNKKKKKK